MENRNIVGFTLIEVLVVILIISIISGVAALTISSNSNKKYESLANDLVDVILSAEEEALLRPITLGMGFSSANYLFYEYQANKNQNEMNWRQLTESPFEAHALPSGTQVVVQIEGKPVPFQNKAQISILPSGELTPFVLLIGGKGQKPSYSVIGEADGNVTYKPQK